MEKPNVIIMGLPHAGTSVITEMLYRIGWQTTETNKHYRQRAEIKWVQDINATLIRAMRGEIKLEDQELIDLTQKAGEIIKKEPQPWAIKDIRFSLTLPFWRRPLIEFKENTIVLLIMREKERLRKSFLRRSQVTIRDGKRIPVCWGYEINDLVKVAQENFNAYCGMKIRIDYNRLAEAIKIFDPNCVKVYHKRGGKVGW